MQVHLEELRLADGLATDIATWPELSEHALLTSILCPGEVLQLCGL